LTFCGQILAERAISSTALFQDTAQYKLVLERNGLGAADDDFGRRRQLIFGKDGISNPQCSRGVSAVLFGTAQGFGSFLKNGIKG
jgi:hypothetical protein